MIAFICPHIIDVVFISAIWTAEDNLTKSVTGFSWTHNKVKEVIKALPDKNGH